MRKNSLLIVIFLMVLLMSGCSDNNSNNSTSSNKATSNINDVMKQKHCTREANAKDDIEVNLSYDILYTGDILNVLKSTEQVTSKKEDNLNIYEKAYKEIHGHYKGLEYYETKVTRTDESVTSEIYINYDKINTKKLLEIEGEEDNIIVDNKASFSKWMELAKKVGVKCEDVE